MSMFKQKVNSKSAIYRDRHILQKSRNLAYENSENWGIRMKNKLLVLMVMLIMILIASVGMQKVYAATCSSCGGTISYEYTSMGGGKHNVTQGCKCGTSNGTESCTSNGLWFGGGAYQHYTKCSKCGGSFNYGSCSFTLSCPTCNAPNARCKTCYSMDPSHTCHTCSYTSEVTTKPTCTSTGVRTYTCSCGASYTESIAATGHSMGGWYTYTAATCTSAGESRSDCSNCSYYESETIPKGNHSYSSKVTTAATCTTKGVRTYTCSICGDTYNEDIAATDHSMSGWYTYTAATCTSEGESRNDCSKCDYYESTTIAKTDHNYTKTCSKCGTTNVICSVCDAIKSHDCHTHSYTGKVTKAATCTSKGVMTYTCSCGDSYTADIAKDASNHTGSIVKSYLQKDSTYHTITSKYNCCNAVTGTSDENHNYGNWTFADSTTSGCQKTCKDCDYVQKASHRYSYTDLNDSYHKVTCPDCGGTISSAASHNYSIETVTQAATCTSTGVKTYTCSDCKGTKTETIAKTDHSYTKACPTCGTTNVICSVCDAIKSHDCHTHSYTSKVTKAATCTSTGVMTYTCSCGDSYTEDIAIDSSNHTGSIVKSYSQKDSTYHTTTSKYNCCNAVTATSDEKHNYGSWTYADSSSTGCQRTCNDCNYVQKTVHGTYTYTFINTSYHKVYCNSCRTTISTTTSHKWDGGSVTKAATCTSTGVMTYTCSDCNGTKTATIAKNSSNHTGTINTTYQNVDETNHAVVKTYSCCGASTSSEEAHDWDVTNTTDSTCTSEGKIEYACTKDCGATKTETIAKKDHNYTDTCPTCGTENVICSVCDDIKVHDCTVHIHSYVGTEVTAATCTSAGTMKYTCDCGESYTAEIAATGHSYGEWSNTVEPTCSTDGTARRDCINCDSYETKTVAATGHSYGEWFTSVAATCTTPGTLRRDCTKCDSYETGTIDVVDHSYGEYVQTETEHYKVCVWCDDEIERGEHSDNDANNICDVCGYVMYVAPDATFTASLSETQYTYDRSEKKPTVIVKDEETTLTEGTHYEVTFGGDLINAGTVTVTVRGLGSYASVENTLSYEINKVDINTLDISIPSKVIYADEEKKPKVTIIYDEQELVKDSEYTVVYSNNVNVGTATATVTGIGNYTGTKTLTFEIVESGSASDEVWLDFTAPTITNITATTEGSIVVSATIEDPVLATGEAGSGVKESATRYMITETNEAPTADNTAWQESNTFAATDKDVIYVWIKAEDIAGNIAIEGAAIETIKSLQASSIEASLSETEYTYDGTAKTPTVIIKDKAKNYDLVLDTDFTVKYDNNVNAGKATVTITGKGRYKDTLTLEFTINKATPTLSAVDTSVKVNEEVEVTYTYIGEGKVTISSTGTDIMLAELINEENKTIKITGIKAGSAVVTIDTEESDNYIATSTSFVVTVSDVEIVITSNPEEVAVKHETLDVTFKVEATGTGITYQWYKSGATGSGTAIDGATNATYTIPAANVTKDLDGTYYFCKVSNSEGDINTERALLTVYFEPEITTEPLSQDVIALQQVTFNVTAEPGNPTETTYMWQVSTDNGNTWTDIEGATNSSYTIEKAKISMNGYKYRVLVGNSKYTENERVVSDVALLTVNKLIIAKPKDESPDETEPVEQITATIAPTEFDYDGKEKQPVATVKYGEDTLTLNTDYTAEYSNNVNAGTGLVTITGIGDYSGAFELPFTIKAATPTITLTDKTVTYNGNTVSIASAEVTGIEGGTEPVGAITYTYYVDSACTEVTTSANSGASQNGAAPVNAGTYYVKATIAEAGNYVAATSNVAVLTIEQATLTITANAQTITFGESIKSGVDNVAVNTLIIGHKLEAISLTPSINEVGTGVITPSDAKVVDAEEKEVTSNYAITFEAGVLTIKQKAAELTLSLANGEVNYNATNSFTAESNVDGTIEVTVDNTTYVAIVAGNGANLTANTASEITYKGIKATETASTITVKFTPTSDNYSGLSKTYTVTKVNKVDAGLAATPNSLALIVGNNGTITVSYEGDGELDVSSNAIEVAEVNEASKVITVKAISKGTATITVALAESTNHLADTITIPVTVSAKSIDSNDIEFLLNGSLDEVEYDYDGKAKEPTVTVTDATRDYELKVGTDYTVKYENNVNAGTATVTITGTGDYTGTKTLTFKINKVTPTITLENKEVTYNGSAVAIEAAIVTGVTGGTTPSGAITYTYYVNSARTEVTTSANSGAASNGTAPVNAGTYYVKATIAEDVNYNTVTSTAATLVINKATPTLELNPTSGNGVYNKEGTFTVTSSVAGTIAVTSEDTNFVTISSGNGSSLTANTASTITYKCVQTLSDALTIKVVLTPSNANYEGVEATYTVQPSDKLNPTLTLSSSAGEVDYNSTNTFDVTASVAGTIEVTSGNTTYVTIVTGNGANMAANTASTVTYKGAQATTDATTITVKFTPTDTTNYNTAKTTYTVNKVNKIAPTLTATPNSLAMVVGNNATTTIDYNGDGKLTVTSNKEAVATVSLADKVATVNGVANGTATITVNAAEGTNYLAKSTTIAVTVNTKALTSSDIEILLNGSLDKVEYIYDGAAKEPAVTITDTTRNITLKENTDYTVKYENNIEVGTAKVIVTGTGDYTGTITLEFTIKATTVTIPTLTGTYTYNGVEQTAKLNGLDSALVNVSGDKATNKGDYTITVSLKDSDNYVWSDNSTANKTIAWSIAAYDLSNATIAETANQNYTGKGITPTPAVTVPIPSGSTTTLKAGTDFTFGYNNNTNVGTATITITGAGNYAGTKSTTFEIIPDASVVLEVIVSDDKYSYDGTAKIPTSIEVKANGVTLTNEKDYTLAYSDNVNAGTVTVTATGKGNYAGNKGTATYSIAKATPTLTASNVTVKVNGNVEVSYNYTGNGTVSATSNNTNIATVGAIDETNKTIKVNGVKAGSAEITISSIATNNYVAASTKITVTVTDVAIEITTHPVAVSLKRQEADVTFTVVATGTGLSYKWYVATSGTDNGTEIAGATSSTYTISAANVTKDLNGKYYYCQVSNSAGSIESNKALLTVYYEPTITTQPTSQTVAATETVEFSVVAESGNPSVTTYMWQESKDNGITWTDIAGATSSSYTIAKATYSMNGNQYRVLVGNAEYKENERVVSNAAILTVNKVSISKPKDDGSGETEAADGITATITPTKFEYDGNPKEPEATVKYNNQTLTLNTDYTVTYANNTEVGTGTATITGIGNYEGTLVLTFVIEDTGVPTNPIIDAKLLNYDGETYVSGTLTNKNVVIELTSTDTNGIKAYEWSTSSDSGFTTDDMSMVDGKGRINFNKEMDQTIYFRAQDEADNYGEVSSIVIRIDKTAPTGNISIRYLYEKDGYKYTNNNNVTMDITAEDNMSELTNLKVALINEDTYANIGADYTITWLDCEEVKSWDTSAGDGLKKVYVIFKDEAGNQSVLLAN